MPICPAVRRAYICMHACMHACRCCGDARHFDLSYAAFDAIARRDRGTLLPRALGELIDLIPARAFPHQAWWTSSSGPSHAIRWVRASTTRENITDFFLW
jgi:hypothetical protein